MKNPDYDVSGFDPKKFKRKKKQSTLSPHTNAIKDMIVNNYRIKEIADVYHVTKGTVIMFCTAKWGKGYQRSLKDQAKKDKR